MPTKSRFFCGFLYFLFYATLLSPHPASSAIRGVVQALAGVGEQGIALVLQVDEVTIRRGVSAAWREAASGIRRDKKTTGSGGKDLTTDGEPVTRM